MSNADAMRTSKCQTPSTIHNAFTPHVQQGRHPPHQNCANLELQLVQVQGLEPTNIRIKQLKLKITIIQTSIANEPITRKSKFYTT